MSADVALLIVAFAALFLGYPVALTLGGTAIVFALAGSGGGVIMTKTRGTFPTRIRSPEVSLRRRPRRRWSLT